MGLLDELKNKAAADKSRAAPSPTEADRAGDFLAVALPAMFRIHQNLTELVQTLEVLREEVPASLSIPGIGEVEGFLQGGYEVTSEGMPPEAVTLRCSLNLPRERMLEVMTPSTDDTALLDRLRRQGLEARFVRSGGQSGLVRKVVIAISGRVPASLRFSLAFDNAALQLVSRNFEELSERRQIFKPAVVTEQWCEQLLKYVLREPNSFMRYEVPRELREQLQRRIESERRKGRGAASPGASAFGLGAMLRIIGRKARPTPAPSDEPGGEHEPVTAESEEERLLSSDVAKKLLQRKPRLELRYREETIDLTGHDGPFRLGRSPDCDLCVDEQHASRVHAFIELRDGRYHLVDDSRNGTHVRFADGRTANLRKTRIPLAGDGRIALGLRVAPGNQHIIGFVAGPHEDGPDAPEAHP